MTDSIHFNRGLLKLCTVTHWRALHRRRTITTALAEGITDFMMVAPRKRLDTITPDSAIGRHIWRVRSIDEWLEVIERENRARQNVGTLEMGLHHGDWSYLIPVPLIYRAAAIADGLKKRAQWVERKRKPRALRRRARKGAA